MLALAILAALGWSLTIRPPAPTPAAASAQPYSDVRLHQDIAARVAAGENYYSAATALQRMHDYPTRPFVTVRPPTLALAAAWIGWPALQIVQVALLFLSIVLWFARLEALVPLATRAAVAACLLVGGAAVANLGLATQHELWAGLLLSCALALRLGGQWRLSLLAVAAALAFRELAMPFALLAALYALIAGQRRELAAWLALIAGTCALLAVHAALVAQYALPTDLASQGWSEHRGPAAPLRDLADVTVLHLLPVPWSYAAALLALFGWLAAPPRLARFAVPLFAGYFVLLAVFAREQNFYWALLIAPALVAGLAFVPRLTRDLAHALLAERRAAL